MALVLAGPHVQVWECKAEDIHFELMTGCPRCGALFCGDGQYCDMPPDWHDELAENLRNWAGHPDADHQEVATMFGDPGLVEYVDPFELEEPPETEE